MDEERLQLKNLQNWSTSSICQTDYAKMATMVETTAQYEHCSCRKQRQATASNLPRNFNRNVEKEKKDMGLGDEAPKLDESLKCVWVEPDAGGSITLADEGTTHDAGMRTNRSRWLKRKYKIGTWNVRSMAAGKVNTIT